jgi:8-oxo-dGTP pyrophosphatase MutT (NUDIX family)
VLLFRVLDRRGGGWHPVTGGVDPDEEFEAGARRELLEETGFSWEAGRWIDLEYSFKFEGRFGPAVERAYGLVLAVCEEPRLDPHEHTAAEWVSPEEAVRRLGFDSQRDALECFSCYLR